MINFGVAGFSVWPLTPLSFGRLMLSQISVGVQEGRFTKA